MHTEPRPASPDAPDALPAPVASRRPRSRAVAGMLSVAAAIAIGGMAFAAGRMTVGGTTSADAFAGGAGGFPAASGVPDRSGFGGGTATIEGTVVSVSDNQLTIQTSDGRTVTVATSDSTTYHAQGSASSSDVSTGQSVSVEVAQPAGGPGSSTSGTTSAQDVTITGS